MVDTQPTTKSIYQPRSNFVLTQTAHHVVELALLCLFCVCKTELIQRRLWIEAFPHADLNAGLFTSQVQFGKVSFYCFGSIKRRTTLLLLFPLLKSLDLLPPCLVFFFEVIFCGCELREHVLDAFFAFMAVIVEDESR